MLISSGRQISLEAETMSSAEIQERYIYDGHTSSDVMIV